MFKIKKLGIIGGMGPLATVRFFERIVKNTKASKDQDHIDMVILNHASLPDRTRIISEGKFDVFLNEIKADFDIMNNIEVDNIVIPCNTSHFFIDEFKKMTDINIINMVEETVSFIASSTNFNKIAVLGTLGTLNSRVYDRYIEKYKLTNYKLKDDEKTLTMDTIYNVKEKSILQSKDFEDMIVKLNQNKIIPILACTELSCLEFSNPNLQFIDAMDILTSRAIEESLEK
ncbi:amino acid racemase [Lagierella sp.]|uniref:aspartate/glutamate racemase family protein n=1 Tax=Lagierella sp. TaxID=2849657 RepID=UPI0026121759|nr:amino acid racemase [Lagierella sp.]